MMASDEPPRTYRMPRGGHQISSDYESPLSLVPIRIDDPALNRRLCLRRYVICLMRSELSPTENWHDGHFSNSLCQLISPFASISPLRATCTNSARLAMMVGSMPRSCARLLRFFSNS